MDAVSAVTRSTPSRTAVLVQRLERGWGICEAAARAEKSAAEVRRLDDHWLALLADYESACRELDVISQSGVPQMTLGGA